MRVKTAAMLEGLAKKGWSQAQLARETGITTYTISHFVTVGTAKPDTVAKIAAALEIPFDSLILPPERKSRRKTNAEGGAKNG